MNVTCKKCGWLSFAISSSEARAEAKQFLAYYHSLTPEQQKLNYKGIPKPHHYACVNCGGKKFRLSTPDEEHKARGCTTNAVIFNINYRKEVMRNCPNFNYETDKKKLSLAGLGVAGEAGEVADLIKKVLHHDVELTLEVKDKLMKEMGDVYWYLEYLCATLGCTRMGVMRMNVEKLRRRHPNGWTPKSQQEKADEAHA